ncbi:hypothetical protein Gogos_020413 [Gossypium gossypioides]|uniref:Uncharacterized protein n=1 Tax=Gossypium gossypioides TaxID=34282 RepID=A0A7J9D544_GOSGO|nr:hypothetical protein [Gossypium gossypioides]
MPLNSISKLQKIAPTLMAFVYNIPPMLPYPPQPLRLYWKSW